MAENEVPPNGKPLITRDHLALSVLITSLVVLLVLASLAIWSQPRKAITVFNIMLPVVSSWVGTVLAFYFGKENFEAANVQVRELIRRMSPEEIAQQCVIDAMKPLAKIDHVVIPDGKTEADIRIDHLKARMNRAVTRLPVVNAKEHPKYMLHAGTIDRYLASGGLPADTLAKLLADEKAKNHEFGAGRGFVTVSEKATVAQAKKAMDDVKDCQDIFVTKTGGTDEPLVGWISNTRLQRYLKA
jgi:hypothetical protein